MDEMKEIVVCKYCGRYEYYGEMRWLSGKCCCRSCYKADYEDRTGKPYKWDDLNGYVPQLEDWHRQEVTNKKDISA